MAPAAQSMAEPLRQQLESVCPGIRVEWVEQIVSTNTALLERAQQGDAGAQLLVARRQTAGRGRQGRTWWSEPDASLTFSLAVPLQRADWSGLSLAVGLAVAESLLGPELGLKWPNDLWLRDLGDLGAGPGRKLGGILIETTLPTGTAAGVRMAVIGVGLNVVAPVAMPDDAQRFGSGFACLQERLPGIDVAQVLGRVAPALLAGVLRFVHEGFAPLRPRYAKRDVLAGRAVQAGDIHGVAAGVNDRGLLLVHTDSGEREIASGEVSVRPC